MIYKVSFSILLSAAGLLLLIFIRFLLFLNQWCKTLYGHVNFFIAGIQNDSVKNGKIASFAV